MGIIAGDLRARRREKTKSENKERKRREKENREGGEEWREVPKSEQARRKTKEMAARMVFMVRRVGLWSSWVGRRMGLELRPTKIKCASASLLDRTPDWLHPK
jgi:hypothetical protein